MNGSSNNVLVLGVTGQAGKCVATNLKRRKANFSVGSRRKANLKELADQFGASRFVDLDDPRTFDEALNNVTSIFLITGYTVDMLVQSKSLIDAAKRNGVTHIVHLGAFTREHDSYATVFAWHQMIEAYLRESGVAWTNLHPNMFMQNLLSVLSTSSLPRDTTAERLSISLRKTGKRLHAICKPGLWPREVQSLPAPSCII
jgi:NAD(P)H dehydrogenase (quinone)